MPTPLFNLDRPLTEADLVTYRRQLSVLQGNILKSHGRDETVSIFITFREGHAEPARDFLHSLAPNVTSAQEQEEQAARFKATGDGGLFTACWLSAAGYRFLGCDTSGFDDLAFRGGLRLARERLDDPSVARWEPKFRKQIHALVTYADDAVEVLRERLGTLRRDLDGIASLAWEFGHAMRDRDLNTFEHFGFLDGISQPIFFSKDLPASMGQWSPAAGPKLVVAKDPLGSAEECGSYFVFRKLEQNVKGFRRRLRDVSAVLGMSVDTAGAMIMGRFGDGTPITLQAAPNGLTENDFNYHSDPQGSFCPFFSHIRKTNPRGATDTRFPGEGQHRIARRGITYGPPTPNGDDESRWPEHGVGVLFQCCQAHVGNQFEFIQNLWANQPNFIVTGVGQDPVAGQRGATRVAIPARRGSAARVPFDFGEFIRMLGGEYFFAPSKSVLSRL